MNLGSRLRWAIRRARHGRRWEAASAHLDEELGAEEGAAFGRLLAEDVEAEAHFEDIRFIKESLAALPEAEPGRSFTLTERDIAVDRPVVRRAPAPMALRLSTIGAAAGVAALAALLAYDFLQTSEEGLLELQPAPLMERAEVAAVADEQAEAAMEEEAMELEEQASTAAASADAEAGAEEPAVAAAMAEEEAEEEAESVDWRSREEVEASAEEQAEPEPEREARFAAERGADQEEEEVEAAAVAASDELNQAATALSEADAEADAADDGEVEAAADALDAVAGEEDGDELLLERGTGGLSVVEAGADAGEAGWETPAEVALAVVAAVLGAASVVLGRRWRRSR